MRRAFTVDAKIPIPEWLLLQACSALKLEIMRSIAWVVITLLLCACTTTPLPTGTRGEQSVGENRFVAPGVRLIYQETARVPLPQDIGVKYKLRAEGLPHDKTYSLWGKWINGRTAEMYKGLRIDSSGRVLRADGGELEFGLTKMLEGESIDYTLISYDKAAKAFVEITPFPIEAQGKGNCRLVVKLRSAKGDAFLIEGAGFAPKQALNVAARSDGEVGEFPLRETDDGTFSIVVAPAVVGKSGGEASVMVADALCAVTVRYKWGDAMTRPGQSSRQAAPAGQAAPPVPPQQPQLCEAELAQRAEQADPIGLAMYVVQLDEEIVLLDALRHGAATVYLGTEKVTQANAQDVLGRLHRERRIVDEEMHRRGLRNIAGDYDVRKAEQDACQLSLFGFKSSLPSDPIGPVSVIQNGHRVEFKGRDPLVGHGVIVDTFVVLKIGEREGLSPVRLVGRVKEEALEMRLLNKADATSICPLGILTKHSGTR